MGISSENRIAGSIHFFLYYAWDISIHGVHLVFIWRRICTPRWGYCAFCIDLGNNICYIWWGSLRGGWVFEMSDAIGRLFASFMGLIFYGVLAVCIVHGTCSLSKIAKNVDKIPGHCYIQKDPVASQ